MVFYLVLERCNKCLIKVGNTCTGRNRNLNVHTCTSYMTDVGVFGLNRPGNMPFWSQHRCIFLCNL